MAEEILKVKIRGHNTLGIMVWEYAEYEQVRVQLFKKLDSMANFLNKGCPRLIIAGKEFSLGQKKELVSIISRNYNVSAVDFCSAQHLEQIHQKQVMEQMQQEEPKPVVKPVFKMGRVDAGTVLKSDSDMTIIGDVDFGAELVAKGNICVLGALRGFASAGVDGDTQAVIVASVLEASKLRIADCVGVAPKDNKSIGAPEYAHISDGNIVIEPVENDSAFDDDERQRGIIGSLKRFFTYDH